VREMTIRDVMTSDVVVAHEDTPFKEVIRLMWDQGVSGLPVLDARDRLVGIITEADLLVVEEEAIHPNRRHRSISWFMHPSRLGRLAGAGDRSVDLRAGDIMSRGLITVRPEASVKEGATTLLDAGVKRLLVVDDEDRLLGVVSRVNLLLPLLRAGEDDAA
jgi:CBS domain-containing protein